MIEKIRLFGILGDDDEDRMMGRRIYYKQNLFYIYEGETKPPTILNKEKKLIKGKE